MIARLAAPVPVIVVLALVLAAACSDSGGDTAPEPAATQERAATATPVPVATPTQPPATEADADALDGSGGSGPALGETIVAPEGQRATEAPLLTPVSLKIGQKLASPSLVSGLTIDFVEVLEDTRCEGSGCEGPGSATVRVKTASGVLDTGETTLVIEGGQTEPTVKKLGKFSAVLVSLEPVPGPGETIDPADYVGTFAVLQ